ncbi:TonB-dependent receptor [Temperatibacter marinus]|uniref:TonB-dependent receptor n=1 Tax=Temperatibacter marinus TaxID=1456591 RepID=A0AA52EI61_9PROT|nr:TonB-dependent receptor [Temperatibacter marinus]WND02959.1 TonB-dependent receptor [Temperatibacter marinus]
MTILKKKMLISSASAVAICIATAAPAAAQDIDYGTLEEMFGQAVTLGATGTPKLASDVPVNMTIISAEEIRRSGARDVPTVLRRYAGIDVQMLGPTGSMVSIRGRNNDGMRLRVLINGRDTFRPYEGSTLWSSLPVSMEEIRQIEVGRGPSTSLYGANAVAGVINIITFSPLHDSKNVATARIGDKGVKELSAVSTISLGDMGGIRLSGGYAELDRFNGPLNASEQLTRPETFENKRFSGDALFNVTDTLKVGFEATYYEGDVLAQTPQGGSVDGSTEDSSFKLYMALDSDFGRWTSSAFKNSNTETRDSVIDIGTGPFVFSQEIEAETKYFDITNSQSVGSNTTLRFSVGYREDSVTQFGGSAIDRTGEVGYKTTFASALAEHALSDATTITGSLRYDSLDSYSTANNFALTNFTNSDFGTLNEISVNIGVTHKFSETDTVKLMYARGFQSPNLFELGGQVIDVGNSGVFTGIGALGGQPNLNSTIDTQYEIQYLKSLESLNGKLNVSVFLRDEKDLIGAAITGELYSTNEPTVPFYAGTTNVGDAETWGLEIDLSGETDNGIRWAARYGYASTSEDLEQTGLVLSSLYPFVPLGYEDRSSKHILTGLIGYEKDAFTIDAIVQYKSGFTSIKDFINLPAFGLDPYGSVDGFWTANLSARYQINESVSVFASGENLLEKRHNQSVNSTMIAERRVWAGLTIDF